jgi:hypothetical protein
MPVIGDKGMTMRHRVLLVVVALSAALVSLPGTAKTLVEIQVAPPPPETTAVNCCDCE